MFEQPNLFDNKVVRTKYSLIWAERTYSSFKNNYARAADIFNKKHNIRNEDPPIWLAMGWKAWHAYVNKVKKLHKLLNTRVVLS